MRKTTLTFHFSHRWPKILLVNIATTTWLETRYLLAIFCLILVACSGDERPATLAPLVETPAPITSASATQSVTPRPSSTLAPLPAVTAPPAATAVVPKISASDQELDREGQLVIDSVVAREEGWLVIQSDRSGRPGAVLGYSQIAAGVNLNVLVEIDPFQAGDILHAALHHDSGQTGTFEFPGPDVPAREGSALVATTIEVTVQIPEAILIVSDQAVAGDGLIEFDSITSPSAGFVALHNDDGGVLGEMLAFTPVKAGDNEGVVITVNWRQATPILHAVLYEDSGEANVFEYPTLDQPFSSNGDPVLTTFEITMPPDVFIINQPVVSDTIVVERVVAYGPSWLVIYFDNEGTLGNAIGWAHLAKGVNEQVLVPIAANLATPLLHIMIHEDVEQIGEFGFPGTDRPLLYQKRPPDPISFRTDPGNYLIARDQEISESATIMVALLVLDVEAWVVVREDDDGDSGEIIGQALASAGVSRNIEIEIRPAQVGDELHISLHWDTGQQGIFEFPDGPDIPLRRGQSIIQVSLTLLPAAENQ